MITDLRKANVETLAEMEASLTKTTESMIEGLRYKLADAITTLRARVALDPGGDQLLTETHDLVLVTPLQWSGGEIYQAGLDLVGHNGTSRTLDSFRQCQMAAGQYAVALVFRRIGDLP